MWNMQVLKVVQEPPVGWIVYYSFKVIKKSTKSSKIVSQHLFFVTVLLYRLYKEVQLKFIVGICSMYGHPALKGNQRKEASHVHRNELKKQTQFFTLWSSFLKIVKTLTMSTIILCPAVCVSDVNSARKCWKSI